MTRKLKLDRELIRTLTPDEIAAVAGGGFEDAYEMDKVPNPKLPSLTGGFKCWVVTVSLEICPTGGCTDQCSGGTDDVGCTTGGGETYTCMDCS